MNTPPVTCRRRFLKTSLLGTLAAAGGPLARLLAEQQAVPSQPHGSAARVALTHGDDRADNVFQGLRQFHQQVATAIGDRRVVIKPNNVSISIQLASTHAECLEGILEFLKSIGKLPNTVIAESAANGPTMEAFGQFGYPALAKKYGVGLVDLDRQPAKTVHVFNEKDLRPHAVKMSGLLLDPHSFVISAAMLKTHDRVLATLSLKNVVFGAPLKDIGFRWGKGSKPGAITNKPIAHGGGIYGINYNLFSLAQKLSPDLAVIDGYAGMEGNGPTGGTAVDHRVALVSPDWLAADRLGVELMGIDFANVGYLNYCAEAGMGQADLDKIEILGEPLARHKRSYQLHKAAEKQLQWMTPPERS